MADCEGMAEDFVRMATELTRQAIQLHEMQLELQRLATTTGQAEERADEKASAAVMALKEKISKLNNREAEKFWQEAHR